MKTAETILGTRSAGRPVIPAKAGIQACQGPGCARGLLDSRLRGNDGKGRGNDGKGRGNGGGGRRVDAGLRGTGGKRKQLGFTLVEVLVALTILAVGIMAVMRLFPMALVQQRRAAERTVIASLARTQLSEVRTGGVGQSLVSWLQSNSYKVVAQAARSYTIYDSWRTSVTRMGQPDVDLYRVVFTVRMHDGRDEEFVTYVTQR